MNSLIFPGQGSQIVGMGNEFYNSFTEVKKIFEEADEKLKFHLSKIILQGPEDKLQLTQNTQPAILTVSYSIFQILKKEFDFSFEDFKFFAGHSLGEYSALVCANSLQFTDAIYLLSERGKAMQNAVPLGKGSMIAVLGLKIEELKEMLNKRDDKNGVCEIANDNADGQIIISGEKSSVEIFQNNLKEKKIKSIPLKVSAPFHCSLMKPAAEVMKNKINSIAFNRPTLAIVNNVNAKSEDNPEKIKKLLIDQIFSTVRWRDTLIFMSDKGVKNFIEIGPGKALSGMVKRTIKNVNSFSINSITDIKNLSNEFKK